MVSFKTLLATLAVQALVASATPISLVSAPVAVSTRGEEGQIQYCEHAKWKGVCRIVGVPINKCHNVRRDWNDRISSIQNMIRSDYHCIWYRDPKCVGLTYDNQKDANLADGNGAFNDSISSYRCYRK